MVVRRLLGGYGWPQLTLPHTVPVQPNLSHPVQSTPSNHVPTPSSLIQPAHPTQTQSTLSQTQSLFDYTPPIPTPHIQADPIPSYPIPADHILGWGNPIQSQHSTAHPSHHTPHHPNSHHATPHHTIPLHPNPSHHTPPLASRLLSSASLLPTTSIIGTPPTAGSP